MLAKRVHRLSGTALVVAVLLLILAMNTGRAAATTGKSGAVAAVEVRLWIHLQGALTGPQFAAVAKGRFTLRVVKFTQSGGVATRTGASLTGASHSSARSPIAKLRRLPASQCRSRSHLVRREGNDHDRTRRPESDLANRAGDTRVRRASRTRKGRGLPLAKPLRDHHDRTGLAVEGRADSPVPASSRRIARAVGSGVASGTNEEELHVARLKLPLLDPQVARASSGSLGASGATHYFRAVALTSANSSASPRAPGGGRRAAPEACRGHAPRSRAS
jgi:hypothetical protein